MGNSRIIVDGVFFQDYNTGIGRVWTELLTRWHRQPIGRRIMLIDRGRLPEALNAIDRIRLPRFEYAAAALERRKLQGICDRLGASLFLSTYFTRPERTATLLLVHDMIPEVLPLDLTKPAWVQKRDVVEHASAFVCVSQNTLRDLKRFYPAVAGRPAAMVHNGVSEVFTRRPGDMVARFLKSVIEPHLGTRPFLLFAGSGAVPYKNIQLLRDALAQMDCSGLGLLLTSSRPATYFDGIPNLRVHSVRLTDGGLSAAYSAALCLVYPSFYEGFGMPVVEAMACGCPVICSDRSSLPEIAGDAALYVDPTRADQLVAALGEVRKPETRRRLIEAGLERAKKFSWSRAAESIGRLAQALADDTLRTLPQDAVHAL